MHGAAPDPPALASKDTTVFLPRAARELTVAALERAAASLGWEGWSGARELTLAAALDAVDTAALITDTRLHDAERSGGPEPVALVHALVELEVARRELWRRRLDARYASVAGVQAGLARLQGIASTASMLDKATEEACRGCGFDRAILFRVVHEQMVAVSVHDTSDPGGARAILQTLRAQPVDLDHALLETEMVRRRLPMLVEDAMNDLRVHPLLSQTFGATSYVAAPIMPEGRVIGFLHADRAARTAPVDALDRATLWAFAEGFGYAFEAVALLERLRQQRDQVRGMLQSTEQLVDELFNAEMQVSRLDQEDSERASRGAATLLHGPPSRLEQLLTRRETEVMRLLASGESNAAIANRLVISEGTVKSHVKHILRKLRASNRAEAVSRYLRLSSLDRSS